MVYMRNKGFPLLEKLQEQGKRVFSTDEAQTILGSNRSNTVVILSRLQQQKRILSLTRGLYALWPPSERKWGLHPLPIIDTFMRFKKMSYYVGLLSAADYHGAAHQKPQILQVMVPKQLHLRKLVHLGISLHVKKDFPQLGIEKATIPSGYVFYSCPEMTALDILTYQSESGGIHNVCTVIKDLIPSFERNRFIEVLKHYPINAAIQRLGYLMEIFNADKKLMRAIQSSLKKISLVPVALTPAYPKKGSLKLGWQVVENTKVTTES